MSLFGLALKSLRFRLGTVLLTALAIGVSVGLLLAVERIRTQTRTSFASSISGTDLIIGARGHPIQILLVSVFHIGYPNNNFRWQTFEEIESLESTAWAIPLSLGDSHRGFRVVGTDNRFFEHFRYGRRQSLAFASGRNFEENQDAVLGAEVAERLRYRAGDEIVVGHGIGEVSFVDHDENPFVVVGILARTGTPADRAVYVTLEGYDAMHEGFFSEPSSSETFDPLSDRRTEDQPSNRKISAALVGLTSRQESLGVQRWVNEFEPEAMTAILPAATLQELWQVTSLAERALVIVSTFVVAVGLAGMVANLLTGLKERRREIAVLRSVGARPGQIMLLLVGEAALITMAGLVIGITLFFATLAVAGPALASRTGLIVPVSTLTSSEWHRLFLVLGAGVFVGLIPGYQVYRQSLADGLVVRL